MSLTSATAIGQLPPLLLPSPRSLRPLPGHLDMRAGLELQGDRRLWSLVEQVLAPVVPCHRADRVTTAAGSSRAGDVQRLPLLVEQVRQPSSGFDQGPEGYRLDLIPGLASHAARIRLSAPAPAGIRQGLRTLVQLIVQYGTVVPGAEISDEPDFPVRGVMLDISRDRVPTMEELRTLIVQLASWKINHLQLYTEHTFAYAGHEDVWQDASPITPAQARELDAWCAAHGIELSANQNCFGHLSGWLRHPRYAPLAEIAADGVWDFNGLVTRTGPFSLCPGDPRSLALVDDLLTQLTPHFTSPLVNIGCDETFDVGQGRSREAVRERGRPAVYLEFVRRICATVARLGRRPQFWADIALEHPEALSSLPEELIGLAWGYEADSPFERWCTQLRSAGRTVWVCPGTSCWRSITGRTSERHGNLAAAAIQGRAHGASGYLVTAWGDLGHRQQWPITLHALAEGAQRAWNADAAVDPRAISLHAFQDRSLTLGTWLEAIGDLDRDLRLVGGKPRPDGTPSPLRNATALFADLHKPLSEPWIGDATGWSQVAERLDAVSQVPGNQHPQIHAECAHTVDVARLAVNRALLRRGAARIAIAHLDPTTSLIPEFRRLWALRSRPGGLERSVAHYQAIADELKRG